MISDELLTKLALDALTDDGARQVLADAILESGWADIRARRLIKYGTPLFLSWGHPEGVTRPRWRRIVSGETGITLLWVRATATVLLFGGWQKKPWRYWYPIRPGYATVTGISYASGTVTMANTAQAPMYLSNAEDIRHFEIGQRLTFMPPTPSRRSSGARRRGG